MQGYVCADARRGLGEQLLETNQSIHSLSNETADLQKQEPPSISMLCLKLAKF